MTKISTIRDNFGSSKFAMHYIKIVLITDETFDQG